MKPEIQSEKTSSDPRLETVDQKAFDRMKERLTDFSETIGLEIKENDYLLKTEEREEAEDGSYFFDTCKIEGILNGEKFEMTRISKNVRDLNYMLRRILLDGRVNPKGDDRPRLKMKAQIDADKRPGLLDNYFTLINYDEWSREMYQREQYKKLSEMFESLYKVSLPYRFHTEKKS